MCESAPDFDPCRYGPKYLGYIEVLRKKKGYWTSIIFSEILQSRCCCSCLAPNRGGGQSWTPIHSHATIGGQPLSGHPLPMGDLPRGLKCPHRTKLYNMAASVKNDVEALISLRTKALQHPGFAEILPTMTMPCLLYAGEDDPVCAENKKCAAVMPNVAFFSLPGLGHVDTFFRIDLVLPHVTQFLATVNRH